jgi:regulator of protease activity HflC (stomatin/prohibitin superfamily)
MEHAFQFLDKLFEYVWQFVPRPYLVIWTHRAVRFRRGKEAVLIGPGVRWYWPLTTFVRVINVTLEADEFKPHVYTTKDAKSVSVAYTMVYWVHDPVRAATSSDNYEQTIAELGESVLSPIVATKTFQELLEMLGKDAHHHGLNALFTKKARVMCKQFGVRVKYCRVHTFSIARVIKLFQEEH